MGVPFFIFDYFIWHYTRAFRDICSLWLNFMWFILHFFSMPLLLRTLFSPWRRINAGHKKGDFEDWAQAVTFNFLSRVVGFFIRIVLVIIGLAVLSVLFFGVIAFVAFWVALPFIAVFSTLWGLKLLFV